MIWKLLIAMGVLLLVWVAVESALALGVIVELGLALGGLGLLVRDHLWGRP